MAAVHGSKADAYLNGYDVGDFVRDVNTSQQRDVHDKTPLNNKGAKEYAGSPVRYCTVTASGNFDVDTATDADSGDYAISTALDGTVADGGSHMLHFPAGAVNVGDRGQAIEGDVSTHEVTGGPDGLMECSFECQSSIGRERIELLLPLAARAGAAQGTGVDNAASSADGGAGYLIVTDSSAVSDTYTVEHSADDITYSTLGSFTAVTADHGHERIEVSGTVERFVRGAKTDANTSTALVAFHRN